jgi:arginyl-tRNA synthetase
MITLDLRHAIARAVAESGWDPATEPKLRPTGEPGTYASSIALSLIAATGHATAANATAANATAANATAEDATAEDATAEDAATGHATAQKVTARQDGRSALDVARALAVRLAREDWIARAAVTGDGYVTVTVTPQALAGQAARIVAAAAGCVGSDVLRGIAVVPVPPADLQGAATWEDARAELAAELAVTLAAAAGATVLPGAAGTRPGGGKRGPAGDAVAFAGPDAVRFALARAVPGKPVRVDPVSVARNSLDNPAYAVRYAHARAASGVRWAATLAKPGEAALPCLPADPAGWVLLDALSWLPERVAVAARRGRPDEFARYLEVLAGATIAALPFVGPADGETLALIQTAAQAARTALAAGLGLLGVAAPDRL